jgi:hypothetical protein
MASLRFSCAVAFFVPLAFAATPPLIHHAPRASSLLRAPVHMLASHLVGKSAPMFDAEAVLDQEFIDVRAALSAVRALAHRLPSADSRHVR